MSTRSKLEVTISVLEEVKEHLENAKFKLAVLQKVFECDLLKSANVLSDIRDSKNLVLKAIQEVDKIIFQIRQICERIERH